MLLVLIIRSPRSLHVRHTQTGTNTEKFHRECRESTVLDKMWFRECLRLLQYLGCVVYGDNVMIFFPMPEHYDLELFLHCGERIQSPSTDFTKVYDFDSTFPQLATEVVLHCAMLKEVYEIAPVLTWLHEELKVAGMPNYYLAHMDLKPGSILVTRDLQASSTGALLPAGKWMVTDFGLSQFYKVNNDDVGFGQTIRDIGSITSKNGRSSHKITRGHGPYEPPEVIMERIDSRKANVWSLACILCDVLAFACGRKEQLLRFRSLRYDGNGDRFYRATESSNDRATVVDNSNTELKSAITEWLQNLADQSTHPWIPEYVAILKETLLPTPSDRPNMREVMQRLEKLPRKVVSSCAQVDPATGLVPHMITMSLGTSSGFHIQNVILNTGIEVEIICRESIGSWVQSLPTEFSDSSEVMFGELALLCLRLSYETKRAIVQEQPNDNFHRHQEQLTDWIEHLHNPDRQFKRASYVRVLAVSNLASLVLILIQGEAPFPRYNQKLMNLFYQDWCSTSLKTKFGGSFEGRWIRSLK